MRWFAKGAILVLIMLGGLLWPSRSVSAHAELVRADPPDLCSSVTSPSTLPPNTSCESGPVLTTAPTAIHLWFSEPVRSIRHGLVVVSPSGKRVEVGPLEAEGQELSIGITATESGTYQVNWQVISDDTHPVVGRFAFSVGQASAAPNNVETSSIKEVGSVSPLGLLLQVTARWLHFLGYALGFGPLVFRQLVLGPLKLEADEKIAQRLGRLTGFGIIGLLVAEPLALLGQTGSLGVGQLFDPDVTADILASSFGRVLAQRIGAALLLWVLVGVVRQGSNVAVWLVLVLGTVLALIDGQASHAVSSGPLLPGLLLNTLHLAAMGVWVGGLLTLLAMWKIPTLVARRSEIVRRFGRLAIVALVWLLVTGTLMACLHLNQPGDLLGSDYGRTLSAKLIVLAIVVGLAAFGIRLWKKRQTVLWKWEAAALLLLLALAGLLVSLPPPA